MIIRLSLDPDFYSSHIYIWHYMAIPFKSIHNIFSDIQILCTCKIYLRELHVYFGQLYSSTQHIHIFLSRLDPWQNSHSILLGTWTSNIHTWWAWMIWWGWFWFVGNHRSDHYLNKWGITEGNGVNEAESVGIIGVVIVDVLCWLK